MQNEFLNKKINNMSDEFEKYDEEKALVDTELLDEESDLGDDVSLADGDEEDAESLAFYQADDETSEGYSF
jgi:hypothetical protein